MDRNTNRNGHGRLAYRRSIVLFLVTLVGCGGSGLDIAPASGIVTLDGKPVEAAGVVFRPKVGPIATATADAEGHFQLMTANEDGALVGEHLVTVTKAEAVGFAADFGGTMGAPLADGRTRKYEVPVRYANPSTADLNATVERDKNNEFDLRLTAKKAIQ